MSIQVLKVLNLKGSEAHKGHHSSGHPLPRQCPWSAHGHWSSWSWWNMAADLKKLTLMWLKKMRQLINLANILVHSHLFQIVSQIFPWRGLEEQATMEEYIKWVWILASQQDVSTPSYHQHDCDEDFDQSLHWFNAWISTFSSNAAWSRTQHHQACCS